MLYLGKLKEVCVPIRVFGFPDGSNIWSTVLLQ